MKRLAVALVLALLVIGAGCTGMQSQESSSPSAGPARDTGGASAGYGDAAKAPGEAITAAGIPADPMLIKNAELRIEVSALDPALERVRDIAGDQNGTLLDLEVRSESGERRSATATVRVPAERFETALGALRGVGDLRTESVKAEDVTEEFVDLRAKQAALAEQLGQYRRIMANTSSVDDVIAVQKEIERVQVQLDRDEGRLRYLESRTSYSRIVLRLEEPAPLAGGTIPSIVEVLGAGVQGFFTVLAGLVVVVLSLAPLAALGGLAWWVYRRYRSGRT